MNKEENNDKKRLSLKERLKDKRERAKLELIFYGIFFIGVIIFARVAGTPSSPVDSSIETNTDTFIMNINDNYEYDIVVTINNDNYHYYGTVLGNNSTINLNYNEEVKSYRTMNKKYYIKDNDNYLLTTEDEVYPYIDNHYLKISTIKEYLNLATKENNTYKVKVSDLILNSESEEYVLVKIEEGDKNIIIDYTPLLKLTDDKISNAIVNITYSNIGNIISLE